jgi:DHA3 family macrolide efflux protein-like MFS transporter
MQPVESKGMRVFILISLAQFVSIVGSMLSSFALGVWIYQKTGSATELALITLFATLPNVLVSPFAGAAVDRWDRRKTIIISECGLSLTTLTLAFLLQLGRLELWEIYLCTAINAVILAFLRLAYGAITPLLVPQEQLGRASGITQATFAAGQLLGPVMAGVLVTTLQIQGVLVVDFLSFFFPILTLFFLRIPKPPLTTESARARGSFWNEILFGWNYLRARPGLLGLLWLFAATNLFAGIVIVLVSPLVLSFATPLMLGTVQSVAGVGMLVGSVVMGVWGGPKRRIVGICGFMAASGVFMMLAGLRPSIPLLAFAGFGAFFFTPIATGSIIALWQSKIAPDVQGRTGAVSGIFISISLPIASLIAGPLADRVFEPLMAEGGPLAGSVGQILGVGPGRGIGLLFIISGVAYLFSICLGYLNPRIRNVQEELPDAFPSEPLPATEEVVLNPVGSPAMTG